MHLDKKYFLKAIGNKRYKNAFEWCAGHGEIGFELITAGLCETLSFSDIHPGSEEWCLKNATSLGLADNVRAYTTPTISKIPTSEKWDLVVGNPPNSLDVDPVALADMIEKGLSKDHIQTFARTTWDIGLKTHRDFFQNISKYLADDADIFISCQISQLSLLSEPFAKYGFKLVKIFDMLPDDPGLKVFHIKSV